MTIYPVATAKEQLSRLIDEALRGEVVTITRHGKPVVELRPSVPAAEGDMAKTDLAELRKRRNARPPLGEDGVSILRRMRDGEE